MNFPEWMSQGECIGADPDLFFPSSGESTTEAKRICSCCTVRKACLQYAMVERIDHGIWGMTSERERRNLRRKRRAA